MWHESLKPYTAKSNLIALRQILMTFGLFVGVGYLYVLTLGVSGFLVIPFSVILAFFILRFFVLMHDCGHGVLFSSSRANQAAGYILGVLTGMPQYVWSKHHAYHHKTNGDWSQYRGPLNITTSLDYRQLSSSEQSRYRRLRHPLAIILIGGFLYVLFNPRFNWFLGIILLFKRVLVTAISQSPRAALQLLKECPSRKWKTPKEFRHMTYNNVALLLCWYFMSQAMGTYNFFMVYTISLSLAGGIGILFFTVQHNFENSYAVDAQEVDPIRAALEGTSYLKLPTVLNWFTADIGYHHVHHLSTAIPNYRLADCHKALETEFSNVKQIRLSEVSLSLKSLLWDTEKKMIVSV